MILVDEISGYVPGATVELTPDNDELGAIVFGSCWPQVRERLGKGPAYTVRVTSVAYTDDVRVVRPMRTEDRRRGRRRFRR